MAEKLKSKLEDASREYKNMNIKIWDFLHGAPSPAATPPAKFQSPMTTPSGRKVTGGEKERERKTPLIEATTFCLQRPRAAHALCSNKE